MFLKKVFSCIFISLFCSILAFSEELTHGVLFHSSAEPVSNRTSLSLFGDKLQKFENTFSIEFDLSIWDIKQFGYILRIINDKNQEVDFVFVNFRGEDDLYLDFYSPITYSSVSIPIDKSDLYQRHWFPVKITFDLRADKAKVLFNDSLYTCSPVGLKNPSGLKFVYGLYGLNLDVPQMVIKNIRIEKNAEPALDIPVNESTGEEIHDVNGRKCGSVKNPEWVINRYHFWQEEGTFHTGRIAGITFNPNLNNIIIFNNDTIISYFPQYKQKNEIKLNNPAFKLFNGEAIYNPQENKSYLYTLRENKENSPTLAIIDMDNYSVQFKSPSIDNELVHHNVFWGKEDKAMYIFGGYGKHTYSNDIFTYNQLKDDWEKLNFSGDKISPRFFSASGQGASPSQILIMGGFGNESGKYEHGGRHLYDLFSIDLETNYIKKLWEINGFSSDQVPCSNLILNKEHTHFYTLCYAHHQPSSFLQLYKFRVADGAYEIVSDSVPIISENLNTTVYLFFSDLMQEFYAVVKEYKDDANSQVHLYSLLAPPVGEKDLKASVNPIHRGLIFGFQILILLLTLSITYFFWRKYRGKKVKTKENLSEKEHFSDSAIRKTNAIYVFGDFTIYDKKGMDISYRFSSKLKSLFALILFHSKNKSGISTEMMTTELWPDKDSVSAKNTRGVTINRLRSILADMEGISLFHQNSKWFFAFEDVFYCDYVESERIIEHLIKPEKNKDEYMHELLLILKRGAIFPNLQESWLDIFKRDFENNIERILWDYITELYENKKYAQLIQYSDLYFIIDPLNEDIMNLCLKSFQKIGKSEQALVLYNKFVSNYRESMGEKPKQKFPI
ncbi:MAG: hypothetical protein FWD60_11175 [Candidatus Azobacteroides sp.]|nr:hypothetical protein [Candidatus Azobacteroides sp.]